MTEAANDFLQTFRAPLDESCADVEVELSAGGSLPSVFAVSDLAQASIGAAGAAMAAYISVANSVAPPRVVVDRALSSSWFGSSIFQWGWSPPAPWDAIAGDYETADGWIKLHTNAPHHRERALEVLGCSADRASVERAVRQWKSEDLETAVINAGGVAAAMRSIDDWRVHPQGVAVAAEPLLTREFRGAGADVPVPLDAGRPLAGLKVLDLTRIIAGPVATRTLAGWGADALRIDPPDWDEPANVAELTVGKKCARLDLHDELDRARFEELLQQADVIVSGYRSDALDRLGYSADIREELRPGIVDVSLDAYGWTGPWATRRGFDSLVQMRTGIADAGMKLLGTAAPKPLPVQALDHATGYLLTAAVLSGLIERHNTGRGSRWRTSLAAMAGVLIGGGTGQEISSMTFPATTSTGEPSVEETVWGTAWRLPPPLRVEGAPLFWTRPPRPLGYDSPTWN